MLMTLCIGVCQAQPASTSTSTTASNTNLSENDIDQAMDAIRHDPNIRSERTQRMLRWQSDAQPKADNTPSGWTQWWLDSFAWVIDLFKWLAESSRMLFWLIIAALAGGLVVLVLRIARQIRVSTDRHATPDLPTHIQNIDIRPETLPDDIGTAAWQLWQRGAQRDALALLYRGTLSRLVNVHRVPIKSSSTEADCLRLSAPVLSDARLSFTAQLIGLWQQAIYGGKRADAVIVQQLCQEFGKTLDESIHTRMSP